MEIIISNSSHVYRNENVQSSLGTLPSVLDRSIMSPDNGLAGWCVDDRELQTHDGQSQQGEVQSTSDEVQRLPYALSCFSAIQEVSLLYTTVAVGPSPPAVVNTSGKNAPCSTSLTRFS